MEIRDLMPHNMVSVTPNDSGTLPAGVIAVIFENRAASWSTIRVRLRASAADITIGLPPGIREENIDIDRVYATSPTVSSDVYIQAYIRG